LLKFSNLPPPTHSQSSRQVDHPDPDGCNHSCRKALISGSLRAKTGFSVYLAAFLFALTLLPGIISAQSFSGQVTDACTGDGVIAVIRVSYLDGFPTNFDIPTNTNGEFNFVLWGYDPQGEWLVQIKGNTISSPSSYTISTGGSGNADLDFIVQVLPDIPFAVHACPTGAGEQPWEVATFNNTCETVRIGNCVPNSLLACWDNEWETMEGLCYTINIKETDASCSTLGNTVYTRTWSWRDLRLEAGCACPTHVKAPNINDYLNEGDHYIVELTWRCCNAPAEMPSRRKWGHIQFVEELGAPAVDFAWNASAQIEMINNDLPIDGIVPRSEVLYGPELGPLSIGMYLYPSMTGGSIENYRILVEEVDCFSGEPLAEGNIYDRTFDAPNGEMPAQFSFLDITVEVPPSPTPQPYFFVTDTEDKCFKATLFASNVCGTVSAYSYFQITQQCIFCLDDEGSADVRASRHGSGIEGSLQPVRILHHQVVPNPARATPALQWVMSSPGSTDITILDHLGRPHWQGKIDGTAVKQSLTLTMLNTDPAGIYIYTLKTKDDAATGRFVLSR